MTRLPAACPPRLAGLLLLAAVLALLAAGVNLALARNKSSRASAMTTGGEQQVDPFLAERLEIGRIEDSLRLQPGAAALRMRLAQLYFLTGNPARALLELEIIEKQTPQDPQLHFRKSTILKQMGRMDEAEKAARLAMKYRPGYEQAQTWLGDLYLDTGRSAEALQIFEKVLKTNPNSFAALMGQGRAREQLYIARHPVSPGQMVGPVQKAVKLNPSDAWGMVTLARMTFNYLMKPDRAEKLALEAARLNPRDAEAWLILTEIALQRPATEANLDQAGRYALEAAQRAPADWRPPYQFGRILLKKNEPAEAQQFFRKSLDIRPTPDAVYQLSQAARRAGQPEEAKRYGAIYARWNIFMEKRKALLGDIQRSPGNPEYYYRLAELYAEADAPEPAENWLKKAVLVKKDPARTAKLTRRIAALQKQPEKQHLLALP